jgi:hypothetical protein
VSGQPLEGETRVFFESKFNHDFSSVRVHTGSDAASSADALDALAFTTGRNIYFGAHHYQPHSASGIRLLAHELAHTVQQEDCGGSGREWRSIPRTSLSEALETDADRAAARIADGQSAGPLASIRQTALQRQDKNKQPQAPKIVPPVAPNKPQSGMIEAARRAAAIRTQTAMFKASGVHGALEFQEARRLAQIKFNWPDPNTDQISGVLASMGGGLVNVDVKVAGPGDPDCASRAGYVRDHRAPIVICPAFFRDPGDNEGRVRTMIHEMAHVRGIGKADVAEQYFPIFDCTSPGEFESADSWANYVHCLSGQSPDQPMTITGGASKPNRPSAKKPGGSK